VRLISPFKDHYDAHLRDGDLSLTWERVTRVASASANPHGDRVELDRRRLAPYRVAVQMREELPKLDLTRTSYLGRLAVGIAGKVYAFYCETVPWWDWREDPPKFAVATSGLAEDYADRVERFEDRPKGEKARRPASRHEAGYHPFYETVYSPSRAGVAAWAETWTGATTGPEPHLACGSPIYLVVGSTILANPNLGNLGIFRLFGLDPFQVAQEIEVYLGNELATQRDPIPARTDELIRDAHGFDKHSFRNSAPRS